MAVKQLSARDFCSPLLIFSFAHSFRLPFHPQSTAVLLTDLDREFTFPNGKAGLPLSTPEVKHLPTNIGDQPYEGILVQLKSGKK